MSETATLTANEVPGMIFVYSYKVEIYDDKICIFDPKGTLSHEGSIKIANWFVQEDVKQRPFKVKVFKTTQ